MTRLFGTDGVRGVANDDLTPELVLSLAAAAARVLGARTAVVGRDTRASGEMLEAAVCAGLSSAGVTVERVGVIPTPGVQYLTVDRRDLGVVLSASHNPMPDNGVKLFGRDGYKLDDALEDEVVAAMAASWDRPTGGSVGRVTDTPDAVDRYVRHLVDSGPTKDLAGLRVVVDCANGAASLTAPGALRGAGAEVIAIHAEPDGRNINDGCGSTHPESLRAAVVSERADAGIALDGDADRCLAVDGTGELVDGDQILAILAAAERPKAVVATVMANLGFKRAMARLGIDVVETKVGDRHVLAAMREYGLTLGGEQSGHVVLADAAWTGDGTLTALRLLSVMATSGRPLRELAAVMERLPQVLLNVRVTDKSGLESSPALSAAVAAAGETLGAEGRVLVRASGTEPIVRVMVEAVSADKAERVAGDLADVVRRELGG